MCCAHTATSRAASVSACVLTSCVVSVVTVPMVTFSECILVLQYIVGFIYAFCGK